MTKKIGVLCGQETSFPEALIEEVNGRGPGHVAEMVSLDAFRAHWPVDYAVILDRISHEVPFYQTFLKVAAINGTQVVNSPFWKLADDKFFGTALVEKLGIAVPRTAALPQREYVDGIKPESLRNLKFPLNWEGLMEWVGWPAIIKPNSGGGWKSVDKVENMDELIAAYNDSKTLCMMVQEFIDWDAYVRCVCIGKTEINPLPWDPSLPHHERYAKASFEVEPAVMAKIVDQAKALNMAFGYDMNTVEFAVKDNIPYAIDFMNTAPDMDRSSLRGDQFEWAVTKMADLLIDRADNPPAAEEAPMRWDHLLSI